MGIVEAKELGSFPPLRIRGEYGRRELNAPSELAPRDKVSIRNLEQDPKIVLLTLVDAGNGEIKAEGTLPFERHILLSRWEDSEGEVQYFMTITGYEFTGQVKVRAWKDFPDYAHPVEPRERKQMGLVRRLHQIAVMNIEGLDEAILWQQKVGKHLKVTDFSLDEAQAVYEAIVWTVPNL